MRLISDAFFHKRPDSFTWIQLRRVGWQTDQSKALRNFQPGGTMSGRTIPDQHKALTFRRVLLCEFIKKELHTRGVQA